MQSILKKQKEIFDKILNMRQDRRIKNRKKEEEKDNNDFQRIEELEEKKKKKNISKKELWNLYNEKFKNYRVYLLVLFSCAIYSFIIKFTINLDTLQRLNLGKMVCEGNIIFNNVSEGMNQWLYNLLLYISYCIGGYRGILIFSVLIVIIIYCVIIKICKLNLKDKSMVFLLSGIFVFVGVITQVIGCSPFTITMMLSLVQIYVMELYLKTNNKKILYILPIIVLLEININSLYWFVHLMLLLAYILPIQKNIFKQTENLIDVNIIKLKELYLPILLMIISLFINLCSFNGIIYILETYVEILLLKATDINATIENISLQYIVYDLILAILIGIAIRTKRKISLSSLWLEFGFTILAFYFHQFLGYSLITLLMVIIYIYKDKETSRIHRYFNPRRGYWVVIGWLCLLMTSILLFTTMIPVNIDNNTEYVESSTFVDAIQNTN